MNIGIIGGGQLGMMMAEAARDMQLDCNIRCLDPNPTCPASYVAEVVTAEFNDTAALQALAEWADVVTYEFENVDFATLCSLNSTIYPPLDALQVSQDRYDEKSYLNKLGLATADFYRVDDQHQAFEYPGLLKTRRLGYDGKGQVWVHSAEEMQQAWQQLNGVACIVERAVNFKQEVSIIAVRNANDEYQFYPLTRNHHVDGILDNSQPVNNHPLQAEAESAAKKVMQAMNYVGVLVIEFFVTDAGLIINEIAPRVHNSGHWTIEGAETSQFANHMLAIMNKALGAAETVDGACLMHNFIGGMPNSDACHAVAGLVLHDYHKAEAKPGRKMGHATLLASDEAELETRYASLQDILKQAGLDRAHRD